MWVAIREGNAWQAQNGGQASRLEVCQSDLNGMTREKTRTWKNYEERGMEGAEILEVVQQVHLAKSQGDM